MINHPKRLALSVPLDGFALAEHAELAREAERLGYVDAWSLEADGIDCFAPLAVVGSVTSMRLGTGMQQVSHRDPRSTVCDDQSVSRRDLARGHDPRSCRRRAHVVLCI